MSIDKQENEIVYVEKPSKVFSVTLSVIIAILVATNIVFAVWLSNALVDNEKIKLQVYLETEERLIENYWLGKIAEYQNYLGENLLETQGALLHTLEEESE